MDLTVSPMQEFDVEKHWWGWRIASLGYRAIYMDSDVVVMRDPLMPFETGYDVQVRESHAVTSRPSISLRHLQ